MAASMGAGSIAACSAQPLPLRYSVDIENKSSVLIRDVAVANGERTLHFKGRYAAMEGSTGTGGQIDPIAAAMTLTWQTEDGRTHEATIPIRLKGATPQTVRVLRFRFTDAGIELYQGIDLDQYSRTYRRIFPD